MRIMLILLFVLALAYSYTDRQLYFYGKSDFKVYHPLPIKVKPDYWGYDKGNLGFVIADLYDFTIVKKGLNKYSSSSEVFANDIAKYGFDDRLVVVAVVDSLGREHTITLQRGDKPEIEASIDANSQLEDATWIEIKGKDDYVKTLVWIRSILRIVLFVLMVVIGIKLARTLVQRGGRPSTSV